MSDIKYRTMAMDASEVDYQNEFEGEDYAIIVDLHKDAVETWQRQLLSVGNSPAVLMEDDIILGNNFKVELGKALLEFPDEVVNFFTLKTANGTERLKGRTFVSTLCYYLPAFTANHIYWYSIEWLKSPRGIEHPDGMDLCIADYLKDVKQDYILYVPNLVQHKEQPSRLGPRSSKRQTKYFIDDLELKK